MSLISVYNLLFFTKFIKNLKYEIKKLLDNIFDSGVRHYSEDNNSDYYLSHVMLDLLRDKLLECDEFKMYHH
jgi:hypothetical protein